MAEETKAAGSAGAAVLENKAAEEVNLDSVSDIPVEVSAVLGRCSMSVEQLLKLGRGAVVKLDRKVGEPIDIYVNGRLIARGEVVIVENRIGITMTEILRSEK
jgi:flagellar motor switch protein FliN/FliY